MSRRGFFLDIQALPPPLSAATHTQGVALYRQQRVLECVLNRVSQQEWGAAGSVKGHSAAAHSVSAVVETDSNGRATFFSSQRDGRVGRHCLHVGGDDGQGAFSVRLFSSVISSGPPSNRYAARGVSARPVA